MKKNFKLIAFIVASIIVLTACNNKATHANQTDNITAKELLAQLDTVKCSCIVHNNGKTTQYTQRGVRDLHALVTTQPEKLNGAYVADKIIGKGAAALLVNGKVKQVATHVITTPALKMLRTANIEVLYEEEIPYVENWKKTGQCPLDARLQEVDDAAQCLPIINQFIEDLNNGLVM